MTPYSRRSRRRRLVTSASASPTLGRRHQTPDDPAVADQDHRATYVQHRAANLGQKGFTAVKIKFYRTSEVMALTWENAGQEEWAGAGSNRRPSAFQADARTN